ncbi:MAG: DUF4124 domain-containing protein [Azoarcus sp.]|jgi:hypothetical protein|nr:DUF4124 domain-containing protein [Azoarcus sp.]
MKKKHPVCFALLALVLALPAQAEIYKWTDKNGQTHFSDIPPNQPGIKAIGSSTRPQPAPGSEAPATNAAATSAITTNAPAKSLAERDLEFRQRRAAAAEASVKTSEDAARADRRAQDCQRARTQHDALMSGQRVSRLNADGGRTFLNDDERKAEIARSQEMIDASCTEK